MSWWSRLTCGTSDRDPSRTVDFLKEALDLESRGDYANALTSYRLALRAHPDDLRVLQNMAIAFSRTGQPEEAIRSYRRALQVDAELAGAHYGLAYLLLKRGDTAHAAMHLESFLRNTTDSDAASAKFRAHAEQTLSDLKNMGQPAGDRQMSPPASSQLSVESGDDSTLKQPDE
ncbi:MAG: tetratricopeptide repeat protein [Gemmatimonadota bacterium]|nr:tetratricopeptide repeat protein [Gemmatimonadota bacterium]